MYNKIYLYWRNVWSNSYRIFTYSLSDYRFWRPQKEQGSITSFHGQLCWNLLFSDTLNLPVCCRFCRFVGLQFSVLLRSFPSHTFLCKTMKSSLHRPVHTHPAYEQKRNAARHACDNAYEGDQSGHPPVRLHVHTPLALPENQSPHAE